MGIQEWTIILGVVVGVTVLLWMAARWRKRRYDEIYSYDSSQVEDSDAEYGAELPSGGARTVGYRDPSDIERMNSEIRDRADSLKPKLSTSASTTTTALSENTAASSAKSTRASAPREQQTLFAEAEENVDEEAQDEGTEEQVPLLLDPSEEHSESSEPAQPEKIQTKPSIETDLETSQEEPSESLSEEMVVPEEEIQPVVEPQLEPDLKEPEQEKSTEAKKPKEKASKKRRKKEVSEPKPSEPPEIVIINLMTSPEGPYVGQPLLRALTELGMRFGEMDIFHYCGKHGDEAPQFRMANLLNPGVFDMEKFDELRTHALCFFFELEPELDNMAIYESMLSVISRLKDELGGEMRDDQRSVFTIQMSEHCRNRIRDFQRRHLVNKN